MDDGGNYFWNPEIGGCSKSTTTCIMSHLLSEDGYKVLVVDMDSQGNSAELLTNTPCREFVGKSVLEAMIEGDPKPYIRKINDNLDVLPSNYLLATFPKWIYTGVTWTNEKTVKPKNPLTILRDTLEPIKKDYDFILIDTPPALSEQTTNALAASDFVVVMYECSYWCYNAVPDFMDTIEIAQKNVNPDLKVVGIQRTLNDNRRSDMKAFAEQIEEDYKDLVFESVISRTAAIGKVPLYGFNGSAKLNKALQPYREIYKELMNRVKVGKG